MDNIKKNQIALRVLGGFVILVLLLQLLWPGLWYMVLLPFTAAAGAAFLLIALYHFYLRRDARTAMASFATPIVLSWAAPIWAALFALLLLMPSPAPQGDGWAEFTVLLLVITLCLFLVPLAGLVLSVLGIIKGARHHIAARDTETRLIAELPLTLAIIGSGVTLGVTLFLLFTVNLSF